MTPESHRRAGELLDELANLPPIDHNAFLDSACGSDAQLRAHVLALLTAERDAPQSFLGSPAIHVAAQSLAATYDSSPGLVEGMQLGAYRIGRQIGRGGMGAVWEAFDLRLQRKAALKILPLEFTGDPDRVRRFQQEARAASQLNHPNIVSIFDADFENGFYYIAAELVEGKTLRQLLTEEPVDTRMTIEIAIQMCSALAAAHEARIVHRDIKPENLMVRPDGLVKVLDFGLAKLVELAPGDTSFRTRPGTIAGTLHYLSPEQVMGKPTDPRSDIFSAGVVLYELATGVRPFDGPTDGAIFTQIASQPPPPMSASGRKIDDRLEALIVRSLERDPGLRFQTANDFRAALQLLVRDSQSQTVRVPLKAEPAARPQWHFIVAALLAGMAISGGIFRALRQTRSPLPSHFERMTFGEGEELYPNLLPDGKQFVYASSARGKWDIYLQRLGGSAATNLTADSDADSTEPGVSKDGSSIVFRSERGDGGLFIMETTGENPRRVASRGHLPTWSPDGKLIAYCDDTYIMPNDRGASISRLRILDLATRTERELATGDAVQPAWSPHGQRIAYWGVLNGGNREVFTVSVKGGAPVRVTDHPAVDVNPVWSPSGKELYFTSDRGGTMNVWRVGINEVTGTVESEPEPVTTPAVYVRFLSWSADGTRFLYSQAQNRISMASIAFDTTRMEVTGDPSPAGGNHNIANFRVSPDETRIVHDTVGDPNEDLWIVNMDGTGRRKLTSDGFRNRLPSWSPQSDEILFISNRSGDYQEWMVRPDGSGLRQFTAAPMQVNAGVWLEGGRRIVASLFQFGLVMLDATVPGPIAQIETLPGVEATKGSYAFVSPPAGGLLLGHINGTGENPILIYSFADHTLTRAGVQGTRPWWVPNTGTRYFVFLREDGCFLYDRQRKQEKQLFKTARNNLYFLQAGAAGNRLYYSQTIRNAQVWLAEMSH